MEEGGSKAEFPLTHQCLASGTCLCSAECYQSGRSAHFKGIISVSVVWLSVLSPPARIHTQVLRLSPCTLLRK